MLSGCLMNYPTTTFWVSNKSSKDINFTATAYKIHFQTMTIPFLVKPNSKVLLRNIGLSEKGNVTHVFSDITFIQSDSILIKDAMNPLNWEKTTDEKGRPMYIFYINSVKN
jgi:hypothetical protein